MKTSTIVKSIILSLLMAGMTDSLFAQQQADRQDRKERIEKKIVKHRQMQRIPRLPNLTDKQKQEIKQIMLDTRRKVLPLQNQMRERAARLKTLRTSEDVNMDAINSTVEEIGDLRMQVMKERLATEQEIRELLTDEQRIMFDSRSAKGKKHRMKQRRNR